MSADACAGFYRQHRYLYMPTYHGGSACSRRQQVKAGLSYRWVMNSGTVTLDVDTEPGNTRRSSLVSAETLNMLEKRVSRLTIQPTQSARPLSSPRMNNDSFLKNFSTVHTHERTLEQLQQDSPAQYLAVNFDKMCKRRCSAPDISDKKLGLPLLGGKTTGQMVATRPKTAIAGAYRKKSQTDENVPRRKAKSVRSILKTAPSMSSLSTHSAPITGDTMKLPARPRSGDSHAAKRNLSVFERLYATPLKRPQTSYNNNESKSDLNLLNKRAPIPKPGKNFTRLDVPRLSVSKSLGTPSPARSRASIENCGNSNSDSSMPKTESKCNENGEGRDTEEVQELHTKDGRETEKTNKHFERERKRDSLNKESNARIIEWLLGVENSSKIIPENAIVEDEENAETAIRIIYPND